MNNKCRGITIPQYQQIVQRGWVYDEDHITMSFKEEVISKEVEPICADCKQIRCKDDYDPKKEKAYLPRT